MWLLVTWAALGCWLAAPPAARGEPAPGADRIRAIEQTIQTVMRERNIPGLSAAIVTDGRLRWSGGYGFADLENAVPARPATVYRLASVSKPIAATAVMQLVERGKLDLDGPIRRYVPAFPEKQWPLTVRHLLSHLGGVRHYRPGEIASTRYYPTLLEGLALFKDDPLEHEPGARQTYTTYGYTLLGCAVEAAAGVPFPEYLRREVFEPAGMAGMRVDSVAEIIPNRAQGYRRGPDGRLLNSGLADTSYKIPGGGLCSTVEDLARFAVALQSGALLKRETLDSMWTRQKTNDGKEIGYGLGWRVSTSEGERLIWHTGGQQRVSTYLGLLPDRGMAIALMCNLEGAALDRLAARIGEQLLSRAARHQSAGRSRLPNRSASTREKPNLSRKPARSGGGGGHPGPAAS